MRKLSEVEILSLTGLLKMEKDGLAMSRAMQALIKDDELREKAEAAVQAAEGRIKSIQQFVNENQITTGEVQ